MTPPGADRGARRPHPFLPGARRYLLTGLVIILPTFTTPNPTSGYFLLVPEDDVIALDISVDEAIKAIISGG